MAQKQTTLLKSHETKGTGNWVVVDVKDQIVGRAATAIAKILRGKNKETFTPNVDSGDFVIVINARHVKFSGNELDKKVYYHHTGFPGGMKSITARNQLEKHPERVIKEAVWGMLPKNTLSRHLMRKLMIYADAAHPHSAQKPSTVNLGEMI